MEIKRKIKQTIENLKYKFWHSRLAWYDDSHEIKLTSLSPSENIEDNDSNIDAYEIALRNVLKSTEANNIAMTGDLGIGKSSILKAYEKRYGEKFIYVSVSDLIDDSQPPEKKKTPEEKKTLEEKKKIQEEIEKNLLKQLIAICRKKDIPASRFRNIPESPSKRNAILFTILTAIFALNIGVVLFWDEIAEAFETFHICIDKGKPFSYFFLVVLSTILVGCSIWNIILNYKLPKISAKASVKDGCEANIEMDTPIEPENLDKNLGEIIYLLEQAGKKSGYVLVIEDMDRFDADVCIPVLVKLRQINVMINQRMRFSNHKHSYKFIYVLKEEIFADKDPYKFFDIMLPVVPSLSNKSSIIYLNGRWKKFDLLPTFIPDIAPYLTDYRKIFHIENEYKIFREINSGFFVEDIQLDDINLQSIQTELMALIIYKIYFPHDFNKSRYTENDDTSKSNLSKALYNKHRLSLPVKVDMNADIFDMLASYMTQRVFYFIGAYSSSTLGQAESLYLKALNEYTISNAKYKRTNNVDYLSDAYSYIKSQSYQIKDILKNMAIKQPYPELMLRVIDYYAKTVTFIFQLPTIVYTETISYNEYFADINATFIYCGLVPTHKVYIKLLISGYKKMKKEADMVSKIVETLSYLNENNFKGFDFSDADLSTTELSEMSLTNLQGATYNSNTIFPKGFDPKAHGMIDISAQPEPETEPETNDSESTTPIT